MKLVRYTTCIILALAPVGTALISATPASASCAIAPNLQKVIATAPIIFVGTVRHVDHYGTRATVRVQQVWRGESIPRRVIVNGSLGAESRVFQVNRRYLFVPERSSMASPFQDDDCTATQLYTPKVARFRPKDVYSIGRFGYSSPG
jgi:hypothetical protein